MKKEIEFDFLVNNNNQEDMGNNKENQEISLCHDQDNPPEQRIRAEWSSETQFLCSCISLSVGLGNVWRFPFTALKNGGGAFLIPYIIVLLVIGKPLYFLELAWGQFSSYGPVKAWEMVPLLKGVGYSELIASICGGSYYCAVMAITIHYLIQSFRPILPWSVCDESWAHRSCDENSTKTESLPELYFANEVMKQKDQIFDGIGTPDLRLSFCLLGAWALIFVTLIKGIKSSGRVAIFTAIFPYVSLVVLLIRGATLPGAWEGVKYFITPQWEKILNINVWFAAVSQCFFSLSIGFGPTIMNASYNNFRHNVYRSVTIVSILDSLTSLLAGCILFTILGNLAYVQDNDVADVAKSGPGLAFISYPEAISKFKFIPQFFSVSFFFMLLTLGIGTATAGVGSMVTIIMDQFPKFRRIYVTAIVCLCGFCLGLFYTTPGGPFLITLVDYYGASFVIFVMATLEIIGVAWIYGVSNFCQDIEFMLNMKLNYYWKLCWGIFVPVGLIVILMYTLATATTLTHNGIDFPKVAIICGWMLSATALAVVPLCAVHTIRSMQSKTFLKKLVDSIQPSTLWGPKDNQLRKEWLLYKLQQKSS